MKFGRLVIFSIPVVPAILVAAFFAGIPFRPSGTISDKGFVLSQHTIATSVAGQLPQVALLPGTVLGASTTNPDAATASASGSGSSGRAPAKAKTVALAGKVYPAHSNIITTWFYVGEPADPDNDYIPNMASAWDDDWEAHFGGVDSPTGRSFTPKENPYYFALPYDDFDDNGNRRSDVSLIPWAKSRVWPANWSMCKNQWIKITKGGKSVYAQWEDVGPFLEDDTAYVFGSAAPANTDESHAGLDVSPTVRNALSLSDVDHTTWQFVDPAAVPAGPWKTTVTTSQIDWN